MIKLTTIAPCASAATIRIEGRLDEASGSELVRLVGSLAGCGVITLDLAGLAFADADGRALLARLRADGCRITGGSLYIQRLMEGV